MRERRIKAPVVAMLAGVRYSCLDYWLRTGAVGCDTPARGRGSERLFSFADVIRIQTLARLRSEGLPLQTVRRAMRVLAERMGVGDPLACGRLLVADGQAWYAEDDRTLVHILTGQRAMRQVVLIDLAELAKETEQKLLALVA